MPAPSLKKNILFQSAYQILVLIVPLITAPYVARILGPRGLGAEAWTRSIANYFVLAAMLGIATHGSRTIARARDSAERLNATFTDLLVLHLVTAFLALMAYAVLVASVRGENRALFAVQGLWVVGALFDVTWLFTGLERFGAVVARNTAVKIATMIAVFALVRSPDDLGVYAAVLSSGALMGNVVMWPLWRRHIRLEAFRPRRAFAHVGPLFAMFLPVIGITLLAATARVILGALADDSQVGYFAAAERILNSAAAVMLAIGSVMVARMSNLLSSGRHEEVDRVSALSFRYTLLVAFAVSFGIAGVSRELAPVFFGVDFVPAGQLMAVWSIAIPFSILSNGLRTQCLIPRSMDRRLIASTFCASAVCLAFSFILVPRLAALGAVLAIVLGEIALFLASAYCAREHISARVYVRAGAVFVIPGALMFAAVRAIGMRLGATPIAIVGQVLAGSIVYMTLAGVILWKINDATFSAARRRFRSAWRSAPWTGRRRRIVRGR